MLETVDITGMAHTSENLVKLAEDSMVKNVAKYGFKVCGFVSDNAANVQKMRKTLSEGDHEAIFMFGCSAHILNLLMKNFQVKKVLDKILPVIKYFQKFHKAVSWLLEKGLPRKLSLPSDTRWNSTRDGLMSFIDAWPAMVTIAEENRIEMQKEIYDAITNLNLKRNIEDYLLLLNPVSYALDKTQASDVNLLEAVKIWHDLSKEIGPRLSIKQMESFAKRR